MGSGRKHKMLRFGQESRVWASIRSVGEGCLSTHPISEARKPVLSSTMA